MDKKKPTSGRLILTKESHSHTYLDAETGVEFKSVSVTDWTPTEVDQTGTQDIEPLADYPRGIYNFSHDHCLFFIKFAPEFRRLWSIVKQAQKKGYTSDTTLRIEVLKHHGEDPRPWEIIKPETIKDKHFWRQRLWRSGHEREYLQVKLLSKLWDKNFPNDKKPTDGELIKGVKDL